jgi:hypothetical protein
VRTTRVQPAFDGLILAQTAHSIEEYAGRLWESFPPARFVSGLISSDLERNFLLLNVASSLSEYGAFSGPSAGAARWRRPWPGSG